MKLGIFLLLLTTLCISCSKSVENKSTLNTQDNENGKITTDNKIDSDKGIINIVTNIKSDSKEFITIDTFKKDIIIDGVNTSSNFQESTIKINENIIDFVEIDLDKKIQEPKFNIEKGKNKLNNTNHEMINSTFN